VISEAADDRTVEEKNSNKLPSRYCATPCYLSDKNKHLNDVELPIDEEIVSKLIEAGEVFLKDFY